MNSDERAAWLEKDDEIDAAQEVATAEGQVMTTKVHNYIADENNISDLRQRLLCFFNWHQSAQIPHDQEVLTHFICFTEVNGNLYELDGRKKSAINHGPSSSETLLNDACNVIKQFMQRDPEEMRFTILALARTMTD